MKAMIVEHPRLASAQRELFAAKIKGDGQEDMIPANDRTLASLLPQRKVVDQLVQIYMDNFETTHRILHVPSFWEEYDHLWIVPQEARPGFIALVLLMIATTNCIKGNSPSVFRGDSSVGRETAIMWIRICDSWLRSQSQKHTNLTIYQLHCLSFMAKQMNSVKRKRTWISAGNLLRLAMSAGLHRDAQIVNLRHANQSGHKKVSLFDQEMRRRIWTTVLEMELLAAHERGMCWNLTRDLIEDCGQPLNIDDETFSQTSQQLPESKPSSHFTRSSYQHLSCSSWPLRMELTSLINGPHSDMPYDDVISYDKKIMQAINQIPRWKDDRGSVVPQVLLQLQLQELLLFLHRPFARNGSGYVRYDYSSIVHLRSAMSIIDLHNRLLSAGNSYLSLFRNDTLGAALSICYTVSFSGSENGAFFPD